MSKELMVLLARMVNKATDCADELQNRHTAALATPLSGSSEYYKTKEFYDAATAFEEKLKAELGVVKYREYYNATLGLESQKAVSQADGFGD